MNEEKSRQLWKIIQEAGDYLLCLRFTLVDLDWPWFTLVMRTI